MYFALVVSTLKNRGKAYFVYINFEILLVEISLHKVVKEKANIKQNTLDDAIIVMVKLCVPDLICKADKKEILYLLTETIFECTSIFLV